jgi:parallel beta-helix repeat protein
MIARRVLTTVAVATLSLGATALGTLLMAAPATAAPPSNTYVAPGGTDTGSCTSTHAPCLTISYALTRTPAGGTVNVAAGTYNEQLTITRGVTISGAGATKTIIDPTALSSSDTDSDSSSLENAIIDVNGTTGVNLKGLGVNGTGASPTFTGCGVDFVGIYFHNASGTISDSAVSNIELPLSLFGCQDGQGIYVTANAGSQSNVVMSGLSVTAYDKNGITCDDVGTFCAITGSTVTGIGPTPLTAQNGIQVVWGSSIIAGNSISANSYSGAAGAPASASGILIFDGGPQLVSGNVIADNDVNIFAGEDGGLASSEPIADPAPGVWAIIGNAVNGATNNAPAPFNVVGSGYGDGIQLEGTANDVDVADNSVNGAAEFGIGLYGVSNASISGNTVTRAFDGISADNASSANTFSKNTATGDSSTDVVDASTGTGTEGTANTWVDTTCGTSSPTGLCVGGSHHPTPPGPSVHPHGPPPFRFRF